MKFHNSIALIGVFLGLALLVLNGSAGPAYKRQTTGSLNEFQQKFVQLFNQYRRNHNLPAVRLDPTLSRAAQNWAESNAQNLDLKHSCTSCENYAEVLAKRRSSRKLPEGVAAAEWVYGSWFGEEDDTYDSISQNPSIRNVGIGIGYRRAPDRSYHVYAVARFST